MAHFAKISDSNEVLSVHVVDNDNVKNSDGVETESVGQQYLQTHSNWPAEKWIQTSYNTMEKTHTSGDNSKALRGNYAGIGFEWDSTNQIFWPERPYASWVKDITTAKWKSPIGDAPALTAEQQSQNDADTHKWCYAWNESGQSWDLTDRMA